MAGHVVCFLLIMALNFLPVLLVPHLDKIFPSDCSDLLKTIFLQALEDFQEYLLSLQEPMLSEFVCDILSQHPNDDARGLISKSDSLSAVYKVWMAKIPSIAITVGSTLPKTRYSLLAIPAVIAIWVMWHFLFSRVVNKVQASKKDRDKAIRAGNEDKGHRQRYVRDKSRLAGRLGLWRALRITCCALLVYCNPKLDKTLMNRLSHQLASLQTILMKEMQSRIKAWDIVCAAFWQMKPKDAPDCPDTETPQGRKASKRANPGKAVCLAMSIHDIMYKFRILWKHLTAACYSSSMQPCGRAQGNSCRDPDRPVQGNPTEGSCLFPPKLPLHYGGVDVCKDPEDMAGGDKGQAGFSVGILHWYSHKRTEDGRPDQLGI
ncbi:hypothetical protein LZ32DRAFT_611232, partial [Colletotrichum eremochloae]